MDSCVTALIAYFKKEAPNLVESYTWKIPNIEGFKHSNESGYLPNVKLKQYFNKQWHLSSTSHKYDIAKQVVSDWGGVRTNRPETLQKYVNQLSKADPATPLKGIASYSKVFSIVDMDKYAIYDARVAACLNAVQWNAGVKKGIAFNYISGRNNVVGHSGKRQGFVYNDSFKVSALVENGWDRVKRDDTYQVYLDTLRTCLNSLEGLKLYDLEMMLFANAEKECLKAIQNS